MSDELKPVAWTNADTLARVKEHRKIWRGYLSAAPSGYGIALYTADALEAAATEAQRLRGALTAAEESFESIRETLVNNLAEPERRAFWEAVRARDKCAAALSNQQEGAK